jgi:hypothetical protein
MIALRGKVERTQAGTYSWKGVWAFGAEVTAASSLPFEYTWQKAVDPSTVSVPSAELEDADDEDDYEEEPTSETKAAEMSSPPILASEEKTDESTTGNNIISVPAEPPQQDDATKLTDNEATDKPDKPTESVVQATDKEATQEEVSQDDVDGEDKTSPPQIETDSNPFDDKPKPSPSKTEDSAAVDHESTPIKKKPFTFADPMTPGDPPFTDAATQHACPQSGEWIGYFETLPRKTGQSNVPVHEQCYLFLNATPPADAFVQFLDEDAHPSDAAKLPEGHVLVRGMGQNQYGKFELIGSLDVQTQMLQCQRIYVAIPQGSNKKGRKSSGSGTGSDKINRYHTRKKRAFSWKQRMDEDTNITTTNRRKRSKSEGTGGMVAGKRLKISIPEYTHPSSSSALTPASVGSLTSDGSARPSPRNMSVSVARKSSARATSTVVGTVGNGIMKLACTGEPSKAHWRTAHFLYYHREVPTTPGSTTAAAAASSATTENEANSVSSKPNNASNNSVPKAVVYEGEMFHGQREGRGICLFNNGLLYFGGWFRNKEHGNGVLMTADRKRIIYSGSWEKGKMSGRGVYYFGMDRSTKTNQDPGPRYDGEFRENLMHGIGTYYFPDGTVYCGSWSNGMMSGRGVLTWPDGSEYNGDMKDNRRSGQGILKASDGFYYDGTWVANAMEGRGTAVYPNGQKYIGLFVAGKREGRGTLLFTNGATYEGRFKEDAIDGQGTLRLSRAMVVPREMEGDDEAYTESAKQDFMIPVSFQSDMGQIHRTAGFTIGGE